MNIRISFLLPLDRRLGGDDYMYTGIRLFENYSKSINMSGRYKVPSCAHHIRILEHFPYNG